MKSFKEILAMAPTATWTKEFISMILSAEENATDADKAQFAEWFEDQTWHDLHHIGHGSRATPGDFFEFAEGKTWADFMTAEQRREILDED